MKITNPFTGEVRMSEKTPEKTQKQIDDEIIEERHGIMRPRSLGRHYGLESINHVGHEPLDRVDQTARDSTDINTIMARYQITGQLEDLIQQGAQGMAGQNYGDFTDAPTFQEALNITIHAKDQFAKLDAHIRNRFENNPAQFLDFMHNKENEEEIYKMGLAKRKPAVEPETTLKDVNETLKKGLQRQKPAGKGVEDDGQ